MSGGAEQIRRALDETPELIIESNQAEPEEQSLSSWPASPAAAFYGLAGEIVAAMDPTTEADRVAVLAHTLVGFGSIIGRSARFVVEDTPHHANEFVVLVGASSKARKGTAEKRVRNLLKAVDDDWDRSRVVSGLASGEGLIHAVRDPVLASDGAAPPGNERPKFVDDGVDDKRLLAIEAEFASTLRLLSREGNILSPILRKAWEDGNLQTLVKRSPARATGAHVSIVGHITSEELRRYLDRTECANGFANRFVFLVVRRSKLLSLGGRLDESIAGPLARRLRDAAEFARSAGEIVFAPTAREAWDRVYPALSGERPGLLGALTGRAEAHTLRLAMLYALLDRSSVIELHHLVSALDLWRYSEQSVRFIFGDSTGNRDSDLVLRALQNRPEGMTRTEIISLVFQGNKASSEITKALEVLLRGGLARSETLKSPGGRRPTERWYASRGYEVNESNEVSQPPLEVSS